MEALSRVLTDTRDLLLLRLSPDRLRAVGRPHLVFGLVVTWLVGVGRYWDDPGAHLLQHLGLGSLAVAVGLAGLLWLLYQPLKPDGLSFRVLLTFVLMTAPPALLYAIPVERWMTIPQAAAVNLWFLAAVALWRVVLLGRYLPELAGFRGVARFVALLTPLALVVAALTALNLERATFDLMGGLRDTTAGDRAYNLLVFMTMLSALASPGLVLGYLGLVLHRRWGGGKPARPESVEQQSLAAAR